MRRGWPGLCVLLLLGCQGGPSDQGKPCVSDGDCQSGYCSAGTCGQTQCGNGVQEPGEECDAGVANADDGRCTLSCRRGVCGDGLILAGKEDCDDGNTVGGDACPSDCRTSICGDAVVTGSEGCDDGNAAADDGCVACQWAVCGDGFVHAGVEECDNGPGNSDGVKDACRSDCSLAGCGDLVTDSGEECDDGGASATCSAQCRRWACGDGVVTAERAEVCDDGNAAPGDGCSASCTVEAGFACDAKAPSTCVSLCGNGEQDHVEVCDDGNTRDDDGCAADCTPEFGWACTPSFPSLCAEICGDGVVVGDEACDTEANCDPNCARPACGNGYRGSTEACDDGNIRRGDGCDPACAVESGYDCDDDAPSLCTPWCGNGRADPGEACDDGNRDDGDGCDHNCTRTGCGNGVATLGEACDDGNTVDSDGCSATCAVEAGWACNTFLTPSACALGSYALSYASSPAVTAFESPLGDLFIDFAGTVQVLNPQLTTLAAAWFAHESLGASMGEDGRLYFLGGGRESGDGLIRTGRDLDPESVRAIMSYPQVLAPTGAGVFGIGAGKYNRSQALVAGDDSPSMVFLGVNDSFSAYALAVGGEAFWVAGKSGSAAAVVELTLSGSRIAARTFTLDGAPVEGTLGAALATTDGGVLLGGVHGSKGVLFKMTAGLGLAWSATVGAPPIGMVETADGFNVFARSAAYRLDLAGEGTASVSLSGLTLASVQQSPTTKGAAILSGRLGEAAWVAKIPASLAWPSCSGLGTADADGAVSASYQAASLKLSVSGQRDTSTGGAPPEARGGSKRTPAGVCGK